MEVRSNRPWEQQALINELKQGRELAKQLKNHLNPNTASSETRQFLVEKIISSYEKTLTKLNSVPSSSGSKSNANSTTSPKTQGPNHQASSKKRKALPKWTEQVQVKSETGLEGSLDDGHGWRKYGQKDILGALHPRGYFRCTHRHVQSCLATKQVQRSDEDPTIFHITYRGQHTCTKNAHCPSPNIQQDQPAASPEQNEQQKRTKLDQFRFSFGARSTKNEENSPAFPVFSSLAATSGNRLDDEYLYMPIMGEADWQFICSADQGSCFSPFYTTSDSDFFQSCSGLSQLNVDLSDSDLAEAGSCLNSVSNSPMGVLDIVLDFPTGSAGVGFDSSFLYGFDFE